MKTSIKKRRKICIFPKMTVFFRNMKFLYPYFLREIGWEKVFGDVLGRKLAFLDYENVDYKKS